MQYKIGMNSPLGGLVLIEEDGYLVECACCESPSEIVDEKGSSVLRHARAQLNEYFAKKRQQFDVPLKLSGTMFQEKVWNALLTIPYGEARSYGEIAKQIGAPKAARAVGGANNKNRLMIFVPCHRVIGANGTMVGYASGIHHKEILLSLEQNEASKKEGTNVLM